MLIHSPYEQDKEHKKGRTDGLRGGMWSNGKLAFLEQIKVSVKRLGRY